MMSTAADVIAALSGTGLPAADARVEAQEEYFYPGTWSARWPQQLETPPVLAGVPAGSRTRMPVTRADVFERASRVHDTTDALDLYVLMCGWGAGWQGITGYRSRRPLTTDTVAERLLASHQAIRGGESPKTVYESLLPGGDNYITYFGPAFFTKWLYFSGYQREWPDGIRPLILDARVARTLGWDTWGWSGARYEQYLTLAAEAARHFGHGPQTIEHALYTLNGKASGAPTDEDARTLVLDDLPESVYAALEARSAATGESVQDLALELLAAGVGVDLDEPGAD